MGDTFPYYVPGTFGIIILHCKNVFIIQGLVSPLLIPMWKEIWGQNEPAGHVLLALQIWLRDGVKAVNPNEAVLRKQEMGSSDLGWPTWPWASLLTLTKETSWSIILFINYSSDIIINHVLLRAQRFLSTYYVLLNICCMCHIHSLTYSLCS